MMKRMVDVYDVTRMNNEMMYINTRDVFGRKVMFLI